MDVHSMLYINAQPVDYVVHVFGQLDCGEELYSRKISGC